MKPRIAIVVADFYADIAEAMLDACEKTLHQESAAVASVVRVPGALEIPFALNHLARASNATADDDVKLSAMIALGCVIRGETYHFEVVADVCARGILQVQLSHDIFIANGVLTVENMAQAKARIGKARSAAKTALHMGAHLNHG